MDLKELVDNNIKQSRHFSVYRDVDDDPDFIEKLKLDSAFKYVIGQQEDNSCGNKHYQLAVGFKTQQRVGTLTTRYQCGNWQPTKKLDALVEYVTNENKRVPDTEIICFGLPPTRGQSSMSFNSVFSHVWKHEQMDFKGAIEYLQDHMEPADYARNKKWIMSSLRTRFYKCESKKYTLDQFNVKPIPREKFKKLVVVVGPPNIGKTQFLLAHFENPLMVTHLQDYSNLTLDNDAIVIDDPHSHKWQPKTLLDLANMERSVTFDVKYSIAVGNIGIPRVIISNSIDLVFPKNMDDKTFDAISTRIEVIEFNKRLFTGVSDRDKISATTKRLWVDRKSEFVRNDNDTHDYVKRFKLQ